MSEKSLKLKSGKKIIAFLTVLIMFALCFSAAACSEKDKEEDSTPLIEKIQYGMAEIEAEEKNGGAKVYGSGFIVSATEAAGEERCAIITNYHVVAAFERVTGVFFRVRFLGEDDFTDVTLRGYNEEFDIAVLVADRLPAKYHVFDFGDAPVLGEEVFSLGYVSHRLSVYDGIVSAKDKWLEVERLDWRYCFETTAAAPDGTSGGPCIDKNGNLIGITCYGTTKDGLLGSLSYKTPAPIIAAIYTRIMNTESKVSIPALGLDFFRDYVIVTLFGEKGVFEIYLLPSGKMQIRNSQNDDFADGATVVSVNGKEVDCCGLIAEIILTWRDTQITVKAGA